MIKKLAILMLIVLIVPMLLISISHRIAVAQSTCSAATPASTADNTNVRQQVILDKVRGDLLLAFTLWKQGDTTMAAMHANHPADELLVAINGDLKQVCLSEPFNTALSHFAALVADKSSDPVQVQAGYDAARKIIDAASSALIPTEALSDTTFNFQVIAGLLTDAYNEYGDSYQNGKIGNVADYQNSMGFFAAAQNRYATIKAAVEQKYPDLAKALTDQWAALAKFYPAVTPAEQPPSPDDLNKAVTTFDDTVSKAIGASLQTQLTTVEYLNNAQVELNDAIELYRAGKPDDAYEKAASAYLDNYEQTEAAVAAKNLDLMQSIETGMKEFRDAIKAGKSAHDLQKMLDDLNAKFAKAIDLFS